MATIAKTIADLQALDPDLPVAFEVMVDTFFVSGKLLHTIDHPTEQGHIPHFETVIQNAWPNYDPDLMTYHLSVVGSNWRMKIHERIKKQVVFAINNLDDEDNPM